MEAAYFEVSLDAGDDLMEEDTTVEKISSTERISDLFA